VDARFAGLTLGTAALALAINETGLLAAVGVTYRLRGVRAIDGSLVGAQCPFDLVFDAAVAINGARVI